MLTLPEFELVRPRSLDEACAALEGPEGEALLVAGGTDLLPNMKHGLFTPRRLVSLRGVSELREIRETDEGGLVLGAGVTLSSIAAHPLVRARYAAFAKAAGLDPSRVLENITTGAANSWSLSQLMPRALRGDYEPGFAVAHFTKDLAIAIRCAERLGLVLPGLALAKRLYDELAAGGAGAKGTQVLLRRYLEQLAARPS